MMTEVTEPKDNNSDSNKSNTELKKLELWLNFWIRSIGLISIFGTILGSILGFFINQRIQNVKELESFERFLVYAVEGNISDRIKLSELYKTLLSNEGWRNRWGNYHEISVNWQKDYYKIVDQLNKIQGQLDDGNFNEKQKAELQLEQESLRTRKQRLEKLINEVEVVRTTVVHRQVTAPSPILSEYTIAIHFLETDEALKSEAETIREILLVRGISDNSIEIKGLSQSWFDSAGGLSSNQIRYEATSEYEAASALQIILKEDYPKRKFNLQTIRGSSPNYISIFLK